MKIRVPLPCKACSARHVQIVGDRLGCCHCHGDRGQADPVMARFLSTFEEVFSEPAEPAVYRSKHSAAFAISRAGFPAPDPARDLLSGPEQTESNEHDNSN
jgi:hypothetical protein